MPKPATSIRFAAFVPLVLALAACGRDDGTLTRAAPLHAYPADDGPYTLVCDDTDVAQRVRSARVFAEGLWELQAKDDDAPDDVRYYRQKDGQACVLMTAQAARKRFYGQE